MDINQKILKYKNIINIVEKILFNIKNKYKFDYSISYPSKITFYKYFLKLLNKIIKNDKDKLKSINNYKGSSYYAINNVLINKSFPFIYYNYEKNHTIKNIKKILENKQKNILEDINNIDYIFTKYYKYLKLSDCILFRTMGKYSFNNENKDFNSLLSKMITQNKFKNKYKNIKKNLYKKNGEFIFNNYVSTTFNLKLFNLHQDFLNHDKKFNPEHIYLILKIKKEHNVPGIYIPQRFFENVNNKLKLDSLVNYNDYESEILLNRNLKIKILKIKTIKINNKFINYSIKNFYKHKLNNKKIPMTTIKIIYAESCPYIFPEKFVPINNYKYYCKEI
jgi:hypothetical protein